MKTKTIVHKNIKITATKLTQSYTTPGWTASYGSDRLGHENGFTELTPEAGIARCKQDIDCQLEGGWGLGSAEAIQRKGY